MWRTKQINTEIGTILWWCLLIVALNLAVTVWRVDATSAASLSPKRQCEVGHSALSGLNASETCAQRCAPQSVVRCQCSDAGQLRIVCGSDVVCGVLTVRGEDRSKEIGFLQAHRGTLDSEASPHSHRSERDDEQSSSSVDGLPSMTLYCAVGTFESIEFASYGSPDGVCGAFTKGACHHRKTYSFVHRRCVHKSRCALELDESKMEPPLNATACDNVPLGDRRLYVQLRCSLDEASPDALDAGDTDSGSAVSDDDEQSGSVGFRTTDSFEMSEEAEDTARDGDANERGGGDNAARRAFVADDDWIVDAKQLRRYAHTGALNDGGNDTDDDDDDDGVENGANAESGAGDYDADENPIEQVLHRLARRARHRAQREAGGVASSSSDGDDLESSESDDDDGADGDDTSEETDEAFYERHLLHVDDDILASLLFEAEKVEELVAAAATDTEAPELRKSTRRAQLMAALNANDTVLPFAHDLAHPLTVDDMPDCRAVKHDDFVVCLEHVLRRTLEFKCDDIERLQMDAHPFAFGQRKMVYRARLDGLDVVVKMPRKTHDGKQFSQADDVDLMRDEAYLLAVLGDLHHPHFYGTCLRSGAVMNVVARVTTVERVRKFHHVDLQRKADIAAGLLHIVRFWDGANPFGARFVHCDMHLTQFAFNRQLLPVLVDVDGLLPAPFAADKRCGDDGGSHGSRRPPPCERHCFKGWHFGHFPVKALGERQCDRATQRCPGYDAPFNLWTVGSYLFFEYFLLDGLGSDVGGSDGSGNGTSMHGSGAVARYLHRQGEARSAATWRPTTSADREFHALISSIVAECERERPEKRPDVDELLRRITDFQHRHHLRSQYAPLSHLPPRLTASPTAPPVPPTPRPTTALELEKMRARALKLKHRPPETPELFLAVYRAMNPSQLKRWRTLLKRLTKHNHLDERYEKLIGDAFAGKQVRPPPTAKPSDEEAHDGVTLASVGAVPHVDARAARIMRLRDDAVSKARTVMASHPRFGGPARRGQAPPPPPPIPPPPPHIEGRRGRTEVSPRRVSELQRSHAMASRESFVHKHDWWA